MKNTAVLIFLFFFTLTAFAQKRIVNNLTTFDKRPLHFGFSLGINMFDLGISHYATIGDSPYVKDPSMTDLNNVSSSSKIRADVPDLMPGFSVAIISSLRLGNFFNLRFLPGLSFGECHLGYNVNVYDMNASASDTVYYSLKSTYLDFPLLLKYKSNRINNHRPYIIGGLSYRIDISETGEEDLVRLKRGSFNLELGLGWDFYLQYFRFSSEFKISLGLNNIIDTPGKGQLQYYGYAFDRVTSNIFHLNFHFE